MTQSGMSRRLYQLFADILTYPTPTLASRVQECAALLSPVDAVAANHLQAFVEWVEETPPGQLEEIYTGTFDLQMVCYPYVGYHLFGESYKRGAFLARLNEEYHSRGFSAERELPDHLAVILRFLAVAEEDEVTRDLVRECIIPALARMRNAFDGGTSSYGHVIQALSLLFGEAGAENRPGETNVLGRTLGGDLLSGPRAPFGVPRSEDFGERVVCVA